jgi:hypothetical protein
MKIKPALLVLFAYVMTFTGAHANEPRWRPIEIDTDISYLIDDQSVLRDGYSINATLAIKPKKSMKFKDFTFGSASYSVQAQCIQKRLTPKHGVLHADAHAEGNAVGKEAISLYHNIVPANIDQKVIAHLCMN